MVEISLKSAPRDKHKKEDKSFERVGLSFFKDRQTDFRIERLAEFRDMIYRELDPLSSPEDKLRELLQRLKSIDYILRTASIPYCTAGGRETYAMLMDAWETTRSETHYAIVSHLYLMQKTEEADTLKMSRLEKHNLLLLALKNGKTVQLLSLYEKLGLSKGDFQNIFLTLKTYGLIEIQRQKEEYMVTITSQGQDVCNRLAKADESTNIRRYDDPRTAQRKEELLRKIEYLWIKFTAKYALLTTDLAWFPEHVGEKWAIVVNQPPAYRGQGIDLNKELEKIE